MWLLSTDRAELTYFHTAELAQQQVYAILSHVWDVTEQTFQETQALRARCAGTDLNPRDLSSSKIRASCILAERHGYKWIWNDTCCIDKTSSAELSEAINSMFTYYALAEVCYAFLRDVHSVAAASARDDLHGADSAFRRSKWHTRGWTLQELIAPDAVVFVSTTWDVLGTKADLADLLHEITLIPAAVLRLEEEVASVSVAGRMSWAARRQTTRAEDEAYCLMGIFGINMPTLYGEGRQAFRRLQEEIMKQSVDTSLFAWGDIWAEEVPSTIDPWDRLDHDEMYLFAPSPFSFAYAANIKYTPHNINNRSRVTRSNQSQSVAAPSTSNVQSDETSAFSVMELPFGVHAHKRTPHAVQQSPEVTYSPTVIHKPEDVEDLSTFTSHEVVGVPTFTMTAYGVHAHVPIVEVHGITIAILLCSHRDGKQIGLLLGPCDYADPTRPLYHTCIYDGRIHWRLALIDDILASISRPKSPSPGSPHAPKSAPPVAHAEWRDVYLTHRPPARPPTHLLMNRGLATPFRISQRFVNELRRTGFRLTLPQHLRFPWRGAPPATVTIFNSHWLGYHDVEVHFGVCAESGTQSESKPAPSSYSESVQSTSDTGSDSLCLTRHWAYVSVVSQASSSGLGAPPAHDCQTHHIHAWPGQRRAFTVFDSPEWAIALEITLVFAPCPLNPTSTYVADISFKRWHRVSRRVLYLSSSSSLASAS